jgi:hypothetical protein
MLAFMLVGTIFAGLILSGTDPLDDNDMPTDSVDDGIADFMDPEEAETVTTTETPVWAWGALIAAIVLGILAALGWMRGRKPEASKDNSEAMNKPEEQP